ncbi:hypothetical protein AB0L20_15105, partial [Streptomyces albidoflavus]
MPESATAALPPAEDPDPPRADGVAHEAAPGPLAGIQGPPAARPRHATRALLRAHLAAAVDQREKDRRDTREDPDDGLEPHRQSERDQQDA